MIFFNGGLYVHIPKCAGTSIRRVLLDSGPTTLLCNVGDPGKKLGQSPNGYNPHEHPQRLIDSLGWGAILNLWKFTFVRDPWDRFASWYLWKNDGRSFDRFLKQTLQSSSNPPRQSDYFSVRDGFYDFIGKVESITEDWRIVKEQLGIEEDLPKLNVGPGTRNYRDMYDPSTRALVARHEHYIISRFNYSF